MAAPPKFTPGPWTVKFRTEICGQRDGKAVHVARVNKENPQLEANAHLIAAAPDLYAALEAAEALLKLHGYPAFKNSDSIRAQARAALAKAEGRDGT